MFTVNYINTIMLNLLWNICILFVFFFCPDKWRPGALYEWHLRKVRWTGSWDQSCGLSSDSGWCYSWQIILMVIFILFNLVCLACSLRVCLLSFPISCSSRLSVSPSEKKSKTPITITLFGSILFCWWWICIISVDKWPNVDNIWQQIELNSNFILF